MRPVPTMPIIIKATSLSKQFRQIKAVDDISFTVNEGEIYGFLGQNGAGKSTTIRMLLSLVAPTVGKIEIFGKNLFTNRVDILKQVGAIIEKPDLYKYLTGAENLSIFARLSGHKINDKKLSDQLAMVGLSDRAHSKVKTYSQGMKQRLGLAVALIHDPRLIILDEPTNGLDPQGIADVRNLILHLSREEKKTVFISSHLLSEMELLADRMLILDKGKKVIEGSVKDLLDPSRMLVKCDIANYEETKEKVFNSSWLTYLKQDHSGGFVFELSKAQIPALVQDLVQMQAEILSITPQHSLEEYFLSLTTSSQHVQAFTNRTV